ncbi:epoxide hydrolase [Amnibacterium sp. CER49]|uniref:epoxide hydrolase family protein n=1 Tax=Amnibacterium sp. CER49 TaxID=3039161 RepID=UPI0024476B10|nr:epoxide hydrolase [Amnibacterium sp. CER49]MDH2444267.1 epoxide hydrolase [Amnibacterium sp. CER49]
MPDAAPAPVDDAVLDDLRRRLRATRTVDVVPGGPERGVESGYLTGLVRYWAEEHDWRAAEDRIRALPWVRSSGGLRAVHQRAADPAAPVVVLLHGWPDSVLRFTRVLPLLPDVHVVVPALPGYPFSDLPASSGAAMADPVAALLDELGYGACTVSGGDIGTSVAESLARRHPEHVGALHLTDVPSRALALVDRSDWTPEERAFSAEIARWQAGEGAYLAEQATKPNTLAAALGDSPAGLAAWIVEKLRSWSDCDGDVEAAFPRDDLLTWVTAYWVTGTIGTSFGPYALREPPVPGRVAAPLAVQLFPRDLLHAPRGYAERTFDVREWDVAESGGHFAAWERPEAFVAGLRKAVALAT